MDERIEIDANQKLDAEIFRSLVAKLKTDNNASELFWRVAPDVAFSLHSLAIEIRTCSILPVVSEATSTLPRLFADTLCGIPLHIEWDAKPNEISLRDKYTAIGRVFNLPNATI